MGPFNFLEEFITQNDFRGELARDFRDVRTKFANREISRVFKEEGLSLVANVVAKFEASEFKDDEELKVWVNSTAKSFEMLWPHGVFPLDKE